MSASDNTLDGAAPARRALPEPRRWTLHGLNNGVIFRLTYELVRRLPGPVSYAIGDAATALAWRLMPATRRALADNMRAARPDESDASLERRARRTLQAYARDTVDFLRALDTTDETAPALFDMPPEYAERFRRALAAGRGAILVTGHFGNWEIGSVIMQRVLHLPLTIVAQAEASAEVNRIRRRIRDDLGVETIEVRQSLDTPLQIRRQLQQNRVVAILMDRHLGKDRVPVTLLDRPAWFLRTPATMGYLSGAPLMPCFVERVEGRRFRVHVGEPIYVRTDLPREEATRIAAQQFADLLTARVRDNPEYWYQFYRYWEAQVNEYKQFEGGS